MKRNLILFVLLMGVVYFINACKESNTTETEEGSIVADASYYPVGEGTSYKYSVERTDSNGNQSNGSRSTLLSGSTTIAGVPYQIQIDTVNIAGETSTGLSYFRKTDSGVFFFLDTTGLGSSIADTLLQYLTIDPEIRLLYIPISDNSSWTAFRINLSYQGIINFNPIEVSVAYDGKENLSVGSSDVQAVKLKFTLKYQTNPLSTPQNFIAYGWLAKDIGFVKWDGNGTIIGAFTGSGVDFADTNSTVVMNLMEFDIK
jgi:hypothetical protein